MLNHCFHHCDVALLLLMPDGITGLAYSLWWVAGGGLGYREDEVVAAHPSCCTLLLACWAFASRFCWEGWFAWDWGGICFQTERDNIYQLVNSRFVSFLRPENWTLFCISSGHCSIFVLQRNSDTSCAFRMQLWSLWLLYGMKIYLHLNPERPNLSCIKRFATVCLCLC